MLENEERFQMNTLNCYPKKLEKKEQNKPKAIRGRK